MAGKQKPVMRGLLLGVALVWCATAQARDGARSSDDDTRAREEEMFGPAQDVPAEASPDAERDNAMFGDDSITTDTNMSARVQQNDNYLAIGGQFYLRYEWNPKAVGDWTNYPVTSPNMFDLYFDARPNDRLRGYFRGRTIYNPAVDPNKEAPPPPFVKPQQFQLLLDEFWLKFDIQRTAFVTAGRQLVRWGSGRFWNPTDFVNTVHRDPLAVFDQRVGITLLKIDFPWEARNWNFYAVADLENGYALDQLDFIGRAEMLVGLAELALSAAKRPDGSFQLGLDMSAGLGRIDLRFEGSLQHGLTSAFYAGSTFETAQQVSRAGDWLVQIMGGFEGALKYNDEDSILLGIEYFYNQLGYDSAELFPNVVLGAAYTPLYFGRHYLAAYAQAARPGSFNNTTFILTVLANLSDKSALARGDWIVRVLTYMDFNAFATYHFGQHGELRYRVPDNLAQEPGAQPYTATGLFDTPVSEVGLGLRLYF